MARPSKLSFVESASSCFESWCMMFQEDLNLFEASEDADEEFYAGGGQYRRHGLEHFPQLWCQNGSYSVYGQVGLHYPWVCMDYHLSWLSGERSDPREEIGSHRNRKAACCLWRAELLDSQLESCCNYIGARQA